MFRVLARYEKHHYKPGDKTVRVPKSINRKPHNRKTGEGLKKVNAEARKWAGVKRERVTFTAKGRRKYFFTTGLEKL